MSRNELIAKIETLQTLEALIAETKAEAETVRNSIKAEMEAADTEELSEAISCAGLPFLPPALTQNALRKSSVKRSTKPLRNRFLSGVSPFPHKKSPLSERLPSHRQRAIISNHNGAGTV